MNYLYDGVGNITKITDALTGNIQDFTYDELGRMKNAIGNSYGQKNYQYDQQGNIVSKDGIYFYGTNGASLHTVTNISGGPSSSMM